MFGSVFLLASVISSSGVSAGRWAYELPDQPGMVLRLDQTERSDKGGDGLEHSQVAAGWR